MAVAATLLIALSIHHRLLFRLAQKAFLVKVGTQLAIAAMGFMTAGLTGILVSAPKIDHVGSWFAGW